MRVLTSQQRNTLESAVTKARKIAELGAYNALHSMAVDRSEPFPHMSPDQRKLRNRLRHKARLLGDALLDNAEHKIDNLMYELAYETWHKMLFAKFLEANNLLMHPDGVAVSMDDCEELATEEGYTDKWDTAANYASQMLPAIFRTDDPVMQVPYSTDERIKLEEIIDGLEHAIFVAEDSLGWVYQYWQSEAKATINASEDDIDGKRLPAVTQLFTEPYMVNFLIDNTLGAWWVSRNPGIEPPVKFEYLRTLDDGTPAAGEFEGWPDKTAEVTSLDPCMGSGHFLVSLFPIFATLRMHEEGLTKEEATDKVIAENLHGLELDARCTQIAAFNLALTAWKFCGQYKELPEMNLACSGIAPKGKVEDWVKLVDNVERADDKERLKNGMRMLYDHFQLAPELGSLLDPSTIKADAFTASFEELQPVLNRALQNEDDSEQLERGVMAAGIAKAGVILSSKHMLILTNVPFVGTRKQASILKSYCENNYPDAKHDLATCFIERGCQLLSKGGTFAIVSPHNWLFLGAYMKFRISLLMNYQWNISAFLGPRSFRTSMYDFSIGLIVLSNNKPTSDNILAGLIVEEYLSPTEKAIGLLNKSMKTVSQTSQLKNPDSRVTLEINSGIALLQKYTTCLTGVLNGDSPKFIKYFWEFYKWPYEWVELQGTSNTIQYYHGREQLIFYDKTNGHLREDAKIRRERLHDSDQRGNAVWGKKGVMVHRMGALPATIYSGDIYDQNGAVIVPDNKTSIEALWMFLTSPKFSEEVRKIDNKVGVTPATLVKVPFEKSKWEQLAAKKYPNGLPKPYSDDTTQWLFHGHPIKTDNPLQVALTRLLGYRWPAESDEEMELDDKARELITAIKQFDHLTDDDGIFCIPSVNAEQAGAERLREYIQQVFAEEWDSHTITQLLEKEDAKSKNLEAWLRDEFFKQHCKLFKNRPFLWQIWDGRKDGFSALVNYHKLDRDNLSKLIYTYLGDWIRMCEAKKEAGDSGAEGLLSAALKLKENLEAILEGEAPYDIFVRWKPLEEQPIGWKPDLNDGVRLNIRPFVEAGVLRNKFNVKWGVDRGKNPPGSPWGEIRDNSKHLSLEEKRAARNK